MKKLLSIICIGIFSSNCFAQLPVSIVPEKKKIVFEEFTGIYCSGCPSGHLISDGLKSTYPNDFFPIYIHETSFAEPRLASDPDFTTDHGAAILSLLNTGYIPVGSINRKVYANNVIGLGKADWAGYVDSALQEDAYVNIAFEASLNIITRELVINTEMCFTDSSAPSTMKLNLAINQNNVEGPQKSSHYNPGSVLPNGNYLHQHQFKGFITGQWGETITSGGVNSVVPHVNTYIVPLDYNGVVAELYDLEIIGFIAEGNTGIINANKCKINYVVPYNVSLIDLGIRASDIMTQDLCDSSFTPEVIVYNKSTITVDSFEVVTSLNGTLNPGKQFYQSIPPGDSVVLSLDPVTINDKTNSVKYLVNLNNYTTYYDTVSNNNYTSDIDIYHIPASSVANTFEQGFEYTSLSVSMPNSYMINTNPNGKFVALQESHFSTATQPIGGFGNSAKSMWIGSQFYKQPEFIEITIGYLDLSTYVNCAFEFSYASKLLQSSSTVKLEFKASNDCGTTWESVWSKQGQSLATVSGLYSGTIYSPDSSDWSREVIDLSAYNGDPNVIIRMEFTPDVSDYTCAGIFMDDFELTFASGIDNVNNERKISLYPNPASDNLIISYEKVIEQTGEIEIINYLGELVKTSPIQSNTNNAQLNIHDLAAGMYIVKLKLGNSTYSKKLIID
jgi:hypothetical protein